MNVRLRVGLAAVGLLTPALVGCDTYDSPGVGAAATSSPTASPTAFVDDGPAGATLLTSPIPPTGFAETAVVNGVLKVNASGCFTLDDEVLLAPYGSTVAADGQGINLEGIGEFRLGQRVRAGGGHHGQEISRSAWPEPMRCIPAGAAPSFAIPQSPLSRTVTTPEGTRYEVTPCGYLSPPPRDNEYDSVVNPEAGLLTIYFTVEDVSDEYTIDYRNDEYCRNKSRFRELILHVTESVPESRGW